MNLKRSSSRRTGSNEAGFHFSLKDRGRSSMKGSFIDVARAFAEAAREFKSDLDSVNSKKPYHEHKLTQDQEDTV